MQASSLVVGLGNPGLTYRSTRHNLGAVVAEAFCRRHRIRLRRSSYRGLLGAGQVGGIQVAVLLPTTFMNLSGEAVKLAVGGLDLTARDIIVVSDDLDLPVGTVRLRDRGSSGGHNGLRSIIEELGTEDFPRLRMGIGRPQTDMVVAWVLGYFTREEHKVIEAVVPRAVDALDTFVVQGPDAARQRLAEGTT